jgi:hypothetical protein
MYTLNLTMDEHQALTEVLECSISELHSEIVHTDRCDFKELLKTRKRTLLQLLETLKSNSTVGAE